MLRFCRNKKVLATIFSLMIMGQGIAVAQVAWVKNYSDALKQAASEKKFIILDISASW